MDMVDIIAIAVTASALGSTIISFLKFFSERGKREKTPTLQHRISNLTKNLESSVAVITEIETEISKRKNLAQQLEADIERYDKLREINKAQVEAITQTLTIPLEKQSRKSLIINGVITFVVGLVFFAIGYIVGGR